MLKDCYSNCAQQLQSLLSINSDNILRKFFPKNEKIKTPGFKNHHIIPQKLKDHPLPKLAGLHIHSRANRITLPKPIAENITRPDAASMTAEERKKLPPNERRTFHQGAHDKPMVQQIERRMHEIVEGGRSKNWNQSQYSNKLRTLISEYRKELKQGNIALNSHHREWATRMQPTGGK